MDPDYDTPERLLEYGKQYQAPRQWQFFTGQPAAIKAIRDAFDTDSDNKMAHQSLVLLRTANNTWVRLEGTIEPELLVAEVHAVLSS